MSEHSFPYSWLNGFTEEDAYEPDSFDIVAEAMELAQEAQQYLAQGQLSAALSCSRRSLALDPNDLYTLILQSRIHTELGAYEEALLDINNALAHCPKNARLYAERALVSLQLGEDREAIDDCESAIFLLGKDPAVLVLCHQVFSQLDEYEVANDAYTRMIDRSLDMPLLFLLRGRARLAINMTRAARGDFRRFCRLTGNALVEKELVAEELLRASSADRPFTFTLSSEVNGGRS